MALDIIALAKKVKEKAKSPEASSDHPLIVEADDVSDEESDVGLEAAAEEMMEAIKSEDVSSFVSALKSFMEQC